MSSISPTKRDSPESNSSPALSERELTTVLAALRSWQADSNNAAKHSPHFDDCEPLSPDEIDALCERLNVGQTGSCQECENISSGGISLGVPGVVAVVSAQRCDACERFATGEAANYYLRTILGMASLIAASQAVLDLPDSATAEERHSTKDQLRRALTRIERKTRRAYTVAVSKTEELRFQAFLDVTADSPAAVRTIAEKRLAEDDESLPWTEIAVVRRDTCVERVTEAS